MGGIFTLNLLKTSNYVYCLLGEHMVITYQEAGDFFRKIPVKIIEQIQNS